MNRDIKFRAWDKNCGVMVYSDKHNKNSYRECDYDFTIDDTGNLVCWWVCDYDDSFGYAQEKSGYLDNIMQYTGLKDINGKEIYEGDIDECGYVVTYVADTNESLGMACGWYLQRDNFESWLQIECREHINIVGNVYEIL